MKKPLLRFIIYTQDNSQAFIVKQTEEDQFTIKEHVSGVGDVKEMQERGLDSLNESLFDVMPIEFQISALLQVLRKKHQFLLMLFFCQ